MLTYIYKGWYYPSIDTEKCLRQSDTDINDERRMIMKDEPKPMFVGVDTVVFDLGVSRAKAYQIIKELNNQLRAQNPRALIVSGRVNRIWYDEACLKVSRLN